MAGMKTYTGLGHRKEEIRQTRVWGAAVGENTEQKGQGCQKVGSHSSAKRCIITTVLYVLCANKGLMID